MEWQPIETAPKDGSVVRLYIPGHPELEGMRGRWNGIEWDAHPIGYSLGREQHVPDPTFWMPCAK